MMNAQREKMRIEAEGKFEKYCIENGFVFLRTGQEHWMPLFVHEKLKTINDRPEIRMLRHFPDYAIFRKPGCGCLVQVKSAKNQTTEPCFTMEIASYDTAKSLSEFNIPVLIVWLDPKEIFWGDWVEKIIPRESKTPRENTNGSHTPMYTVYTNNLKTINNLLKDY